MLTINQVNCITSFANTGLDDCPYDIGYLVGMVGVPYGTFLTEAQAADAVNELAQMAQLDARAQRALPVYQFEDTAYAGDSEPTVTTGAGNTRRVRRNKVEITTRLYNGIGHHKRLAEAIHNSQGRLQWYPVFDLENERYFIAGVPRVDASGAMTLYPWKMSQVWVPNATPNTGSEVGLYNQIWTLADSDYLSSKWGGIEVEGNPFDVILGFQDVYLKVAAGTPTGHILVDAAAGNANLFDQFSTQLAATSAWVARNANTGATIAVTAVTANAGTKQWDLTTAATSGTTVAVNLAAPSVLDGLNVPGYESTGPRTILIP